MKTALEWAEYLPLQIKLWFIEECERQEAHFTCEYPSLVDAICGELFDWSYTEFGYEFWDFVWHIALDYQGREAEILSDYIDETIPYTKEEVEAMILEFADPNDEVCKVMLANMLENRITEQIKAIEQNTEDSFKPLHDNQTTTMDGFYSKLKLEQENEALKAQIADLQKEFYPLHRELNEAKALLHQYRAENGNKGDKIEELMRRIEIKDNTIKALEERINGFYSNELDKTKPETNHKPSLFQRFLNLFK